MCGNQLNIYTCCFDKCVNADGSKWTALPQNVDRWPAHLMPSCVYVTGRSVRWNLNITPESVALKSSALAPQACWRWSEGVHWQLGSNTQKTPPLLLHQVSFSRSRPLCPGWNSRRFNESFADLVLRASHAGSECLKHKDLELTDYPFWIKTQAVLLATLPRIDSVSRPFIL